MEKKEQNQKEETTQKIWVTYRDKDGNIKSAPSTIFEKLPKEHFWNPINKLLKN